MSKGKIFCKGCGQYLLEFNLLLDDYQIPCTTYEGKSREEILYELQQVKKLNKEEISEVLNFYNFKGVE